MVCDDGREYYAVNRDMPVRRIRKHQWLMENVVPHLPKGHGDQRIHMPKRWLFHYADRRVKHRETIAAEVAEFIRAAGPDVQLWANYGAYDHVALAQLWGRMIDLPEGVPMFTHDIQQEARRLGFGWDELPSRSPQSTTRSRTHATTRPSGAGSPNRGKEPDQVKEMAEQPFEPQAHGVRIEAQPGDATISLDGVPIPRGQVVGYSLEHDVANALPILVLHTRQPDGAAWEGLARVAVADPQQDTGEQIAAFLANINPAALERAALERDDLADERYALTAAMLATLADWAQGKEQP
ncbi:hypothetical protein ACBR37_19360 [Streptomyces sp. AD55]